MDSLDVGYEVKPILTRYEGFFDCLGTTLQEEGFLGLFKVKLSCCLGDTVDIYSNIMGCSIVGLVW